MNKFRRVLEQSLHLASVNQLDAALRELKRAIKEAVNEPDPKWLILLAKNEGLLFEKKGRLDRAKASYRLALKYSESDPYLHYSLVAICQKLGQGAAARRHLAECKRIALEQGEQDLLEILDRSNQSD